MDKKKNKEYYEREIKLLKELLKNRDNMIEALMKNQDEALKREQNKNEATINTIKDISKTFNKKECIIAVVSLILLFIIIIIMGLC